MFDKYPGPESYRFSFLQMQFHNSDPTKSCFNISLFFFIHHRNDLVGVKPPVKRTEEDFEPGAMFHIVIDYSFLR